MILIVSFGLQKLRDRIDEMDVKELTPEDMDNEASAHIAKDRYACTLDKCTTVQVH